MAQSLFWPKFFILVIVLNEFQLLTCNGIRSTLYSINKLWHIPFLYISETLLLFYKTFFFETK